MAAVTESNKWLTGRKTFCLITGASRGFGHVLATRISRDLGNGSLLLLLARDEGALIATKEAIAGGGSADVRVAIRSCDLGYPDFDRYVRIIEEALSKNGASAKDFDEIVIIHNAATLGPLRKALEIGRDSSEWAKYYALNLTSPACLNSAFFKVFADANSHKLIVNVSSLAAVKPSPILSLYCTGKAARDQYFATVAAEEPSIKVLNYAPGPLDTEMFHSLIIESRDSFPEIADRFQKMIDDGLLLTCEMTTEKMLSILQTDSFTSGSHVDYHDP